MQSPPARGRLRRVWAADSASARCNPSRDISEMFASPVRFHESPSFFILCRFVAASIMHLVYLLAEVYASNLIREVLNRALHAVCAHRRLGNVLTVCPYVLRLILNAKELLMSLISIRSFVFEISARVAALPIRVKSDFDGRLVRSRGLPEITTHLLFAF